MSSRMELMSHDMFTVAQRLVPLSAKTAKHGNILVKVYLAPITPGRTDDEAVSLFANRRAICIENVDGVERI